MMVLNVFIFGTSTSVTLILLKPRCPSCLSLPPFSGWYTRRIDNSSFEPSFLYIEVTVVPEAGLTSGLDIPRIQHEQFTGVRLHGQKYTGSAS